MSRILSIDPGHTTGIAIYDEAGNFEMSMTVDYKSFYKRDFIERLIDIANPDVVLLEEVPTRYTDRLTYDLYGTLVTNIHHYSACSIVSIKPSQWKDLVKRVEIPGQHARDAATMCRWYIESKRENDDK